MYDILLTYFKTFICFYFLDTGFTIASPDEIKKSFMNNGLSTGVDVVIDCSGYGPAIEQNFNLLSRGGKICLFGVCSPETKIR